MTFDTYEKAMDIRKEIDHLQEIYNLLRNVKGHDLVARKSSYVDGRLMKTVEVINEVHINDFEPILQRLVDTVQSEISALEEKFKNL